MCTTHRKIRPDGTIVRTERCFLLEHNPRVCKGGANNNKSVHECCSSGDMCNQNLAALLPHEIMKEVPSSSVLPMPTTSPEPGELTYMYTCTSLSCMSCVADRRSTWVVRVGAP